MRDTVSGRHQGSCHQQPHRRCDSAAGRIGFEFPGDDDIGWQEQGTAFGLCGGDDFLGGWQQVMLARDLPLGNLRCKKGVGHAAADDDGVGKAGEVSKKFELA